MSKTTTTFNVRRDTNSPMIVKWAHLLTVDMTAGTAEPYVLVDGLWVWVTREQFANFAYNTYVDSGKLPAVKSILAKCGARLRHYGLNDVRFQTPVDIVAPFAELVETKIGDDTTFRISAFCLFLNQRMFVDVIANHVSNALTLGHELATVLAEINVSTLKPLVRLGIQTHGANNLQRWADALDDANVATIRDAAETKLRDIIPLVCETTVPPVETPVETTTPTETPFDVDGSTIKQLRAYAADNDIDVPRKCNRVTLAALIAKTL